MRVNSCEKESLKVLIVFVCVGIENRWDKNSLQPLNIHKDSDFVLEILNKFRDGDVRIFIRDNKSIQIIGYKQYLARRAECSKINALRREVMMEMRELS
ncbi:hypothetical protein KUTeg_000012 [Tegillarca granosa]|uniref:Uncharacterized protein n=1 Tax=Tegillarca granosa TaxID=220873 RepID=A0ABQ9G382_TEGGR|nr:hypothetical protein KUTeg_000012 [Tegillarca granosa]